MIKVFIKGLVFGSGFTIALIVIGFVATKYFESRITSDINALNAESNSWDSLSDEQKFLQATAIAIVRYSDGEEGVRIGSITEIHKSDPNIDIAYEIGQLYPDTNYYPKYKHDNRTGAILLIRGSSARNSGTWFLYDDRVAALGDMPLELLIKKFKQENNI